MNRHVTRNLILILALTGLVACGTTAATPRVPDPVAPEMLAEPTDAAPAPAPAMLCLDADFDGTDDAIEALSQGTKPDRRNPWHRFTISGAFMLAADFDTTLQVDSKELGAGAELSLEDVFNLDDQAKMLRIGLNWRITRHHMLGFSWFDIDRTGDVKIREEFQIGEEIFPAGANVQTRLETEIFKLNYWWNFVAEEDWELGVGLGIYWMRIDAEFRGRVALGEEQFDETIAEGVKVDIPPPLIGLRGAWAITDRLRLSGSAEILYVPIDIYRGWIFDLNLGLEWDILNFAGIGLGYNYFNIGIEADQSDFKGKFDYSYHALLGSIYFYF